MSLEMDIRVILSRFDHVRRQYQAEGIGIPSHPAMEDSLASPVVVIESMPSGMVQGMTLMHSLLFPQNNDPSPYPKGQLLIKLRHYIRYRMFAHLTDYDDPAYFRRIPPNLPLQSALDRDMLDGALMIFHLYFPFTISTRTYRVCPEDPVSP